VVFSLTLFSRPATVIGQDVLEAVIERHEYFTQCTTNRADITLDRRNYLDPVVFPASSGSVFSVNVTGPGGLNVPLNDNNNIFSASAPLSTPPPAGAYTFKISTANQGLKTLSVSLPGIANGIPPVRVANYPAARAIDASQDFTLEWDKVPKLNPHDYLYFSVVDTNGSSVYSVSSIDISQTQVTIPAGTLQPNKGYGANLFFRHYFSLQNHQLPVLSAREVRVTTLTLITLNPAGVFTFGPDPVLVDEQDGTASVSVHRTQGSSGDVEVD
jgi:hypothetical protein